jgi:hypothetical protein
MDPTNKEIQLQRTARLLKFVNQQLDIPVSQKLREAAKNSYCTDDYVPVLCKTIRGMTEDQLNTIVYNGRDATSRDLADWWDEHEAADRRREAKEQERARQQALAESAMQKISREELVALKKWLLK